MNYGTGNVTIEDPTWSSGTNTVSGSTTFGFLDITGGTNTITSLGILTIGTASTAGPLRFLGSDNTPTLSVNNDNTTPGKLRFRAGSPVELVFSGTGTSTGLITGAGAGGILGNLDLNGATRTFNIGTNAAVVQMTIAVPLIDSAGTGGVTKTGAGTFVLSSVNSYTGPTTVSVGTLLITGSIGGSTVVDTGAILGGTGTVAAVTVNSGGALQGGDGTAASGALTSGGAVAFADGSFIRLTLGAVGAHSSLARTGGTWAFASAQAFTFTLLPEAAPTTYDNVITGLAGTETGISSISTWLITNPGVTGIFSYDGAGGVDLAVTAVPEPTTTALLAGALGLLGFVRRRRGV